MTDEIVDSPQLRVFSLSLLPAAAKLELIRSAVRSVDFDWLDALVVGEVFRIDTEVDLYAKGSVRVAKYHPEEFAEIASLACMLESSKIAALAVDPYSLKQMDRDSRIYVAKVDNSRNFTTFFQERVVDFLREWDLLKKNPHNNIDRVQIGLMRRTRVTAAILLATACAMNDIKSIRRITECDPLVVNEMVSPALMGMGRDKDMLFCPAAIAIWFGQREALEALLIGGWNPCDPIGYDRTSGIDSNGPFALAASRDEPVACLQWLTRQIARNSVFTPPSVMEWVFEAIKKNNPEGAWTPNDKVQLHQLACIAVSKNECSSLSGVLSRQGAFDLQSNEIMKAAVMNAQAWAFPELIHRVDWSKWSNPKARLNGLNDFPPIALAVRDSNASEPLEDLQAQVLAMFQACADAGHASILAISDDPNSPVRIMAICGLAGPLLACLEYGADPYDVSHNEFSAATHAANDPATEQVLLAFMARKAARSALDECTGVAALTSRGHDAR